MSRKHIVVFSGGSAANNLVDVFGKLASDKGCSLSYIIPISDNGGSSSELIRVFGGPGIGDVRSRLVRLIPDTPSTPSNTAIKTLFAHRLTALSPTAARTEWLEIVEARHPLWTSIPSSKRELIRSFLNTINMEIVKRARPSSVFNFQSASVGNLFLTGARLFTGSFESAIYLLGAITGVPGNVQVVPAINSNFSYHISAGLEDGTVITGQNAISHPSVSVGAAGIDGSTAPTPIPTSAGTPVGYQTPSGDGEGIRNLLTSNLSRDDQEHEHDSVEDANLPGSHPSLRISSIHFSKHTTTLLSSRISRIWYINPYGQEIRPAANPKVLESLEGASCVIYSIGSLYTSLVPSLILRGVGEGIAGKGKEGEMGGVKYKVLILNGCLDRETSVQGGIAYGAVDFVKAIAEACTSSFSPARVPPAVAGDGVEGRTNVPREEWRNFVTHIIYLAGDGTPRVEKNELAGLGIDCVRVYGRKGTEGMIYNGVALGQALEAIIGKRDPRSGEKSRRNTLNVSV